LLGIFEDGVGQPIAGTEQILLLTLVSLSGNKHGYLEVAKAARRGD
jgi:hypothetical protein